MPVLLIFLNMLFTTALFALLFLVGLGQAAPSRRQVNAGDGKPFPVFSIATGNLLHHSYLLHPWRGSLRCDKLGSGPYYCRLSIVLQHFSVRSAWCRSSSANLHYFILVLPVAQQLTPMCALIFLTCAAHY